LPGLLRQGIALAFQSEEIVNAIQRGALGRIAVSLVDFADDASVRVPFLVISDTKSADRFAAMVLASEREKNGNTSISGIWTSVGPHGSTRYASRHRCLWRRREQPRQSRADINMTTAGRWPDKSCRRQRIADRERRTRRCPILPRILTGHGAFMVVAKGAADFGRAIRRKLILEVS
jgi:hypothetical protein